MLLGGAVIATYAKRELPNYQVFDERRYFTPGQTTCVFDVPNAQGQVLRDGGKTKTVPRVLGGKQSWRYPEKAAAKTGDGKKYQIVTEFGLVSRNEAASAKVVSCA